MNNQETQGTTGDVDPASVDRVVLLPCPFCRPIESANQFHHPQVASREEPVVMSDRVVEVWCVICPKCEARGPLHFSEKAAVDAWCRRQDRIEPALVDVESICRDLRSQITQTFGDGLARECALMGVNMVGAEAYARRASPVLANGISSDMVNGVMDKFALSRCESGESPLSEWVTSLIQEIKEKESIEVSEVVHDLEYILRSL